MSVMHILTCLHTACCKSRIDTCIFEFAQTRDAIFDGARVLGVARCLQGSGACVATTSQPSHVASCCFLERLRVFLNALFLERLGSPIESCMERLGRRCLPLGTPSLQHVDQFWTGSRCPPSWFLPSYSSKDPMSWQRISMRLRNEDQLHIDL